MAAGSTSSWPPVAAREPSWWHSAQRRRRRTEVARARYLGDRGGPPWDRPAQLPPAKRCLCRVSSGPYERRDAGTPGRREFAENLRNLCGQRLPGRSYWLTRTPIYPPKMARYAPTILSSPVCGEGRSAPVTDMYRFRIA